MNKDNCNRFLTAEELSRYGQTWSLSKKAIALVNQQRATWDLAAANYRALQQAQTRNFSFGHVHIDGQFNPGRIRSSSADTSAGAILARPCFLCAENRPEQQFGIPLPTGLILLVNPFPIFPCHLTIPSDLHTNQQFNGNIPAFLHLCRSLEEFTVFYNGPRCGASAPDHLHFQAAIRNQLPIEEDLEHLLAHDASVLYDQPELTICSIADGLRRFLYFSASSEILLAGALDGVINILQTEPDIEPMFNIVGWFTEGKWQVLLFPRAVARPWQYYAEDRWKLLISPAAVELAGLVIFPRESDFQNITREDLISIFSQVTAGETEFELLKKQIPGSAPW